MNNFWIGFEKSAIALRPEYNEAFRSGAKNLLGRAKDYLKKNLKVPVIQHTHDVHIPKATEEALGRVASKGTADIQKAVKEIEDLKKMKPKDLLLPLGAGGLAVGSSVYLGQSLGRKLSKSAPGVFTPEDQNKKV